MPWQLEIKGNALYLEGPGLATVGKTDLKMSQEVKVRVSHCSKSPFLSQKSFGAFWDLDMKNHQKGLFRVTYFLQIRVGWILQISKVKRDFVKNKT